MIQAAEMKTEGRKIHPHKFVMWLAIGSITMMFAGLTSAYIVRQAQGNWRLFHMPGIFWVSTIVIVLSSVTLFLGVKAFKQRHMRRFRALITATLVLGLAFGACQAIGFHQLYTQPQPLVMAGDAAAHAPSIVQVSGNPSESFLFVIFGLHLAHIAGGIIALLIVFLLAYRRRVKVYKSTGLEVISSYWHFVDLLWLYLFFFFLANQ